ncbi:MAG TPA: hypothetical protein VEU74_08450, partial [Gemmatimonadales bacterium]|nr:hypothetical protein [Gemmatimonadales bacterium]
AWQVLQLTSDLEEAFHFRRGAERDSQVPPELERRAKCISFHDVRFDGQGSPPKLIECAASAWMVRAIGSPEEFR